MRITIDQLNSEQLAAVTAELDSWAEHGVTYVPVDGGVQVDSMQAAQMALRVLAPKVYR
jgi:hypothetical protein